MPSIASFSRRYCRACTLLLTMLFSASLAVAQAPDPFPLAKGLRENGMADLALEYLKEKVDPLAASNASIRETLLLERAKTLLEAADQAEEEANRVAMLNQARDEFEKFLKGNPPPAQAAEAAVAVARIISLQAESQLIRAAKAEDNAVEKAEAAKARPMFQDASKRLEQAAKQLAAVLEDNTLPVLRRRDLQQELIQTELNQAITRLKTASTFVRPTANEVVQRGKLINDAREEFKAIAAKYRGTSAEYIARAWQGQCEVLSDAKSAYEKIFQDLARVRSPAAAAGVRLARYFEAKAKYDNQDYAQARKLFIAWLRDYGRGRQTPEAYAARYYLGLMQLGDVLSKLPKDPGDKEKFRYPLPPAAVAQLREIEREFRRIAEADNEFTEKASKLRMRVIRAIVGDASKKPPQITDFDECNLTAIVKYQAALEADGDERKPILKEVVALLERSLQLAPPDSVQDLRDAKLKLASAYLLADQPYQAAVLAESLARSIGSRNAKQGALAGLYALQAYIAAAKKLGPTDALSRQADEDRAMAVAKLMHEKFSNDPNTDSARFQLGQLLFQQQKFFTSDPAGNPLGGAFNAFAAVSPNSPLALRARILEGVSAFEILRPTSDFPDAVKQQVRKKVVSDLQAVPAPSNLTPPDDVKFYVQTQLLLAQLHLMEYPKGLPEAEKICRRIAQLTGLLIPEQNRYAVVAGTPAATAWVRKTRLPQLSDDDRRLLSYQIEETRLKAVYGQIAPAFQQEKYTEVLARLEPELATMDAAGPALADGMSEALSAAASKLDEFRREKVIVLALQTRIRQGNIQEAERLFALLEKLGGSLEATINALTQLLAVVRPQIEELRAQGGAGKAKLDALIAGVAKLLDKVGSKPNLSAREYVFLGRSLKDIGSYDEAATILEKVPPPANRDLLKEKNPNSITNDADRLAVIFYRGAQLELARTYRLAGKISDAEKVLQDAMGDDNNPGWAKTSPEFRKEALYTLEDKAATINSAKQAQPIWAQAAQGWAKIANEYQAYLRQPIPADPQKAAERKRIEPQVKAMYFETFYEYLRCLTRANETMLANDPDKLKASLSKLADQIAKVEANNPDLAPEVKEKFVDLLEKYPRLRQLYIGLGGKGFLKATTATNGTAAASN